MALRTANVSLGSNAETTNRNPRANEGPPHGKGPPTHFLQFTGALGQALLLIGKLNLRRLSYWGVGMLTPLAPLVAASDIENASVKPLV